MAEFMQQQVLQRALAVIVLRRGDLRFQAVARALA